MYKRQLKYLRCLAEKSRRYVSYEISLDLYPSYSITSQLKTEKSIFHQFLKGIRSFSFGVYSKIRELYPSRRFLHIQNGAPGKFFHVHRGAFLIYSWCRLIISIIFNLGSIPGQFWAKIQIPRPFFILNNGSGSIRAEFYMMSKFSSKWRSHHRPLVQGFTVKSWQSRRLGLMSHQILYFLMLGARNQRSAMVQNSHIVQNSDVRSHISWPPYRVTYTLVE